MVELVPTAAASAARYVLHVADVRLELGDDFSESTVRRILEVLRSC